MNDIHQITHADNIRLREDGKAVVILDQSLLPGKTEYLQLETAEEMYDAIFHLRVRGAPAIGICAAYCLYVLACRENALYAKKGITGSGISPDISSFMQRVREHGEYLKSSRPTAVNLAWAVERMTAAAARAAGQQSSAEAAAGQAEATAAAITGVLHEAGIELILDVMKQEALHIHEEDIAMCRSISEYGLELIKDGDGILTHCNAGPLATSRYGTALGPILLGKEKGLDLKVFADETRPLLQGARLTAYELQKAGVDVTLICDNMAATVMKNGWVQACFVGCDRVAANGDTANKIGTSGVAILAKHYGIPFYVLGPTSTIDLECRTGDDIPIELRDGNEIKEKFYEAPVALSEVKCYNPAFDVTDNRLITAIITENGICRSPFGESLKRAKV